MKKYSNIFSDMSGLIDSKYNQNQVLDCIELIKEFLGECGPKRLLFGTDFPVQTHKDSIMFIEQSMKGYSFDEKKNVYYNNAKRIFG